MSPKEKAKELVKKYYKYVSGWTSTNKPDETPSARYEGVEMKIGRAKQCALIAIDEICEAIIWHDFESPNKELDYWNSVKLEVQNLPE